MPATYDKIQTTTLSSSQTSLTFSSISQNYTDLVLVSSVVGDRSANADSLAIRFNGDSSSIYAYIYAIGETSSGPASNKATSQTNIWIGNFISNSVANPSATITNIQNYSNTSTNKTILTRNNAIASAYNIVGMIVGNWASTAAITSITVRSETGNNFLSGSTFTLYGIKAA